VPAADEISGRRGERRHPAGPAVAGEESRRYSDHDVARLNRIAVLLEAGLNLAGISYVLELEAETQRLKDEIGRLRRRQG